MTNILNWDKKNFILFFCLGLMLVDMLNPDEVFGFVSWTAVFGLLVFAVLNYRNNKELVPHLVFFLSIIFFVLRASEYIEPAKRLAAWIFVFLVIELAYLITDQITDRG